MTEYQQNNVHNFNCLQIMNISDKITQIRKEKKISLAEMAEKMGISYQGLQQMIKLNDYRVSQLEKIATILEIPISSFFSDFENEIKDLFVLLGDENNDMIIEKLIYTKYEKLIVSNKDFYNMIKEKYQERKIEELAPFIEEYEKGNFDKLVELNGSNFLTYVDAATKNTEIIKQLNSQFIDDLYNNFKIKWFLENNIITHGRLTKIITKVIYPTN